MRFRELTPEEYEKIDRLQLLKNEIAQLELQQLEKRKEIEYYEQRKEMDYVPVTIWAILFFSQLILFMLDILIGFDHIRFSMAIAMASVTPTLAIFFGVLFIKSLNTYIYRNSQNAKKMAKAVEKGIPNRWMITAKLNEEMAQINAKLRMFKKEYNYLKQEVEKIQETE